MWSACIWTCIWHVLSVYVCSYYHSSWSYYNSVKYTRYTLDFMHRIHCTHTYNHNVHEIRLPVRCSVSHAPILDYVWAAPLNSAKSADQLNSPRITGLVKISMHLFYWFWYTSFSHTLVQLSFIIRIDANILINIDKHINITLLRTDCMYYYSAILRKYLRMNDCIKYVTKFVFLQVYQCLRICMDVCLSGACWQRQAPALFHVLNGYCCFAFLTLTSHQSACIRIRWGQSVCGVGHIRKELFDLAVASVALFLLPVACVEQKSGHTLRGLP